MFSLKQRNRKTDKIDWPWEIFPWSMGNPISLVLNPLLQVLLPGAGTRGFVDLGSRVIQIKAGYSLFYFHGDSWGTVYSSDLAPPCQTSTLIIAVVIRSLLLPSSLSYDRATRFTITIMRDVYGDWNVVSFTPFNLFALCFRRASWKILSKTLFLHRLLNS